jgi:translocation protein SEC66
MAELNGEEEKKKGTSSRAPSTAGEDEPVLVDQNTPTASLSTASKKKKGKK